MILTALPLLLDCPLRANPPENEVRRSIEAAISRSHKPVDERASRSVEAQDLTVRRVDRVQFPVGAKGYVMSISEPAGADRNQHADQRTRRRVVLQDLAARVAGAGPKCADVERSIRAAHK